MYFYLWLEVGSIAFSFEFVYLHDFFSLLLDSS